MEQHIGPRTATSDALHAMKYRARGEDFREAINRSSFALKDNDDHYHQLRDIQLPMRFMMGGRIQSAMGSTRNVSSYNCMVSGTIADSFVDGPGSIMHRATEGAATMRMGCGIGYDFSTLRPRGDLIRKLDSAASGPVSFMPVFSAICLATSSSGHRRGAQMGILRVDHPDIEEFINAKQNETELRGFNISVAITNEFMEAVYAEKPFALRFNGEIYREVDAVALWEKLMRSTHDWSEPGVIFIDRINEMNNLWYAETIACTNPCAEQPLPPFGACLLGSFNLTKYLRLSPPSLVDGNYRVQWTLDFDQLKADIPPIVRALDNVVDRSRYPLAEQRAEAVTKRRMGIGIAGGANALEACGHAYGTPSFLQAEEDLGELIRDEAYRASIELAREKGSFPLFDAERYLQGRFIQTLPEDIRDGIARYGIRNSHLTSIAPTGTISLCADNISSAWEPVFSYKTQRAINTPDGQVIETIEDYGSKFLGIKGRLATDVSAQEHVDVLVSAQRYVDSAVSKTVNMDSRKMSWNDFKELYRYAWENGAKSCSTHNASGKRAGIMSSVEDGPACMIDPESGRMECA